MGWSYRVTCRTSMGSGQSLTQTYGNETTQGMGETMGRIKGSGNCSSVNYKCCCSMSNLFAESINDSINKNSSMDMA